MLCTSCPGFTAIQKQGCNGYILDLRNNPGGLVKSGMDIARLWMDGTPVLFNVTGRTNDVLQQVCRGAGCIIVASSCRLLHQSVCICVSSTLSAVISIIGYCVF